MVTAAHLWPGLTPREIRRMEVRDWLVFAAEVDRWSAEQDRLRREAARGGR